MRTFEVSELKSNWSRLLSAAQAGEVIIIAKDGRPFAQLGPPARSLPTESDSSAQ